MILQTYVFSSLACTQAEVEPPDDSSTEGVGDTAASQAPAPTLSAPAEAAAPSPDA